MMLGRRINYLKDCGRTYTFGLLSLGEKNIDFRKAKVQFVHELVKWSGLDKLPKGSKILDVGCGIGGSSGFLLNTMGLMLLELLLVLLK